MTFEEVEQEILDFLLSYFRRGTSINAQNTVTRLDTSLQLMLLHWGFSTPVQDVLRQLILRPGDVTAQLIHHLRDNAGGLIRGQVNWPHTERLRLLREPYRVAYYDPNRTYSTPENEVLVYVVQKALAILKPFVLVNQTEITTQDNEGSYLAEIENTLQMATRVSRLPILRGSEEHLRRPSERLVGAAARSRKGVYRKASEAYRLLQGVESRDPNICASLLRETVIGPLERWRRFELFAAVKIAHLLSDVCGLPPQVEGLILRREPKPILRVGQYAIYWNSLPQFLVRGFDASIEEKVALDVLRSYGYRAGVDRPDIVVVDEDDSKVVLIVECKFAEGDADARFRDAIFQLARYAFRFAEPSILGLSVVVMWQLPERVGSMDLRTIQPEHPLVVSAADLLDPTGDRQRYLRDRLSLFGR